MTFVRVRAKWHTSVDNWLIEEDNEGKPRIRMAGGITRKAGELFEFPENLVSGEPSLELASVNVPAAPPPAPSKR